MKKLLTLMSPTHGHTDTPKVFDTKKLRSKFSFLTEFVPHKRLSSLLFAILVICSTFKSQPVFAKPPVVAFQLFIDADPVDASVFHVYVQPQFGASLHNGCVVNIDVVFTFLDENNNAIETQELNMSFFGTDAFPAFSVMMPTNMMQYYATSSCSNAVSVDILTDFYYTNGASCNEDSDDYNLTLYINGQNMLDESAFYEFTNMPGSYTFYGNLSITNPAFELPLNVNLYSSTYVCDAGQLLYAVPYGGCPPYTISWEDPLENPVDGFDAPEDLWNSGLETTPPFEDFIVSVIAANQLGLYTVTITDANSNTLTAGYEILELQEESSFQYDIQYNNCDAILTISPTPDVEQITGSSLRVSKDNSFDIILPSCTWPCTLTKTLSQPGIYYITLIKNNSREIYCFQSVSVNKSILPNPY